MQNHILMISHYQEVHNLKQEIRRLRLQIADITVKHDKELKRLKEEIIQPKCDLNSIDADWTDAMRVCCQAYDVTPDLVISSLRKQSVVYARHMFSFLCRKHLKMTFSSIGYILGRDHSSVMNAINVYDNLVTHDKTTRQTYETSVQLLGDYLHQRTLIIDSHLV
jgi:chromosomal replication initiation ATPase DnaA